MDYYIISIKAPDLGARAVSKSVWENDVVLNDMGYMRVEKPVSITPEHTPKHVGFILPTLTPVKKRRGRQPKIKE